MENTKTTVSLPESIVAQVEAMAHDLSVSRYHPGTFSSENDIREYEDYRLCEQINSACENVPPDETEQRNLREMQRLHRRLVKGDW